MRVPLEDFRWINIWADEKNNIVIFPISEFVEDCGESNEEIQYYPAYFPIELNTPYNEQDLAQKIQLGIAEWNIHECYKNFSGKNTLEEKYYNISGFKNATKGKKLIRMGWDDIQGKYVSLLLPCKVGYAYIGIERITLPHDANWKDYACKVLEFLNMELKQLKSYNRYKHKLNI